MTALPALAVYFASCAALALALRLLHRHAGRRGRPSGDMWDWRDN